MLQVFVTVTPALSDERYAQLQETLERMGIDTITECQDWRGMTLIQTDADNAHYRLSSRFYGEPGYSVSYNAPSEW